MQTTNQPQTTNTSNVRDASVRISAEHIRLDLHPTFYALPLYIQKLIREYLDERPLTCIWSTEELMDAYLATQGIFRYTLGILAVANAIHNPLPRKGVTNMEPIKSELIIDGVEKVCVSEKPIKDGQDHWEYATSRNYDMALKLAAILANLTSSDKWLREDAKKKVRELVKLGQEIER